MKDLLRFNFLILMSLISGLLMVDIAHGADLIRDPTAPLISGSSQVRTQEGDEEAKKKNISLILQGVLIENGRKVAVINNRLLRVGEQIEGYKVTSIVDYGANLSFEEETLSLSLFPEQIKISKE